ncbi:chloride channel protein [candidate division KSB1 bacterium]|nr:chloride channel protein [candidate division KSB1 bacterium]
MAKKIILKKGLIKKLSDKFVQYTQFSQTTYVFILGIIIGILGGFVSIGFRWLIIYFQTFTVGEEGNILAGLATLPFYWKIIIPVLGAAFVGPLIYFFAREAKGHGVPEVMQAIALKNGVIRPRVAAVKAIASAVTISTGGSVGQEGPIIQVGSALGSTIGQLLKVSPERLKILVGCGAAAGIAATFNAPIAGAFFALEIILGNFALLSFSPIIISSVMATVISRAFFGNYAIFTVPQYSLVSIWEVPLYMVLGLVTGLVGLAFTKSVYASERFFDKLKMPEYLKTPFGAIFLGILIILSPHVFGGGYETIELALEGKLLWHSLLLLILFKLLATSVTLGSGGSGGVFAPALFIGAVAGGAFGYLVNFLFPSVTASSGAYAMVGMGAVVAATTHAPITSILILFEITNDYRIILPIMITCTIATILARKLKQDSIYTLKLTLRGISIDQGREEIIMKSFSAGDVMRTDPPTIEECSVLKDIIKIFMENQEPYYYVITDKNKLIGSLSTHLVKTVLSAGEDLSRLVIAKDLLIPSEEFVTADTDLATCMHKFERVESEHLPVIESSKSRRLIGSISKKEIIKLYNREILRKDMMGVKYVRDFGTEKKRNLVQLPKEFDVDFISVPPEFIGKSLKQVNIRAEYNITILAVKQKLSDISQSSEMPNPDRIFQEGDILVAAGREEDVERLRILATNSFNEN